MKKPILGCVDSISEGIAKIVFYKDGYEKNVFVHVELLPSGAKEGSWLSCAFTLETDAEAKERKRINELYDLLG